MPKQRTIYNLTEAAIELVPVMAALGQWGSRWLPASEALMARAKVLSEGGPKLWVQFMDGLQAHTWEKPCRARGNTPFGRGCTMPI